MMFAAKLEDPSLNGYGATAENEQKADSAKELPQSDIGGLVGSY
jgi:hypothetical protein